MKDSLGSIQETNKIRMKMELIIKFQHIAGFQYVFMKTPFFKIKYVQVINMRTTRVFVKDMKYQLNEGLNLYHQKSTRWVSAHANISNPLSNKLLEIFSVLLIILVQYCIDFFGFLESFHVNVNLYDVQSSDLFQIYQFRDFQEISNTNF